jgi:hypothetical protein
VVESDSEASEKTPHLVVAAYEEQLRGVILSDGSTRFVLHEFLLKAA